MARTDPLDAPINLPAGVLYSHWELRAPARLLEFDFTIHDDPGTATGLYFAPFNGRIDGAAFYFGLQTDVNSPQIGRGVGKGLIFSTWWSFDAGDTRTPADGFIELGTHEGRFVGVRRPWGWLQGHYRVGLERSAVDVVNGNKFDWFDLWIVETTAPQGGLVRPVETGPRHWIGSLRFPRRRPSQPATVEALGTGFLEVYSRAQLWREVPRFVVDVMAFGDGDRCRRGNTAYTNHRMPNADVAYLRELARVRMAIGAGVSREHRGCAWR